jgi:hypothetical protein
MSIVALLLAQSRSAWIGTAAGVTVLGVIFLWTASKRRHFVQRKHEIVMPAMLLVVALGFFFLVSPEAGNIGNRIQSTVNAHSSAVEYRAQLAAGAIKMIKDRPIVGQGVGLYSLYQERYTNSGMMSWMLHDKQGNYVRPSMGEMAHDLYLQTAAELGIPGAIVFFCIPLFFLAGGLRKVSTMDAGIRRSVMLAAIASTVAFAVDAAGSPSWQYGQVSLFFWIVLGLGVGSLRPRNKHYSSALEIDEKAEIRTMTPALGFMRGAAVLAGITLAIVMLPSLVYAGGNTYGTPEHADIEPKNQTIFSFQSETYSLTVTFSSGAVVDVTQDVPQTVFSVSVPHQGSLGTPATNNDTYTASLGPEVVTITGTYTQTGSPPVSDSTPLNVERGG